MASLRNLLKKNSLTSNNLPIRRFFSSEAALESPSFAHKIRDLPNNRPQAKIKPEVSQVTLSLFFLPHCSSILFFILHLSGSPFLGFLLFSFFWWVVIEIFSGDSVICIMFV